MKKCYQERTLLLFHFTRLLCSCSLSLLFSLSLSCVPPPADQYSGSLSLSFHLRELTRSLDTSPLCVPSARFVTYPEHILLISRAMSNVTCHFFSHPQTNRSHARINTLVSCHITCVTVVTVCDSLASLSRLLLLLRLLI